MPRNAADDSPCSGSTNAPFSSARAIGVPGITVSVSAESGSQRVLDHSVGKQLDLARIHQVAADAHRAGVPLLIHYMIGLPGETAEEINQTLELALTLWDDHGAQPAVQFATPLPGTRLAEGRRLPVALDLHEHSFYN